MSTRSERRALQEQQRAAKNSRLVSANATTVLLLRHGETDWNKSHRLQGQQDIPLNDIGRSQAQALASRLSTQPLHIIYSSDLVRANETAQIIAKTRNSRFQGCAGQGTVLTGGNQNANFGSLDASDTSKKAGEATLASCHLDVKLVPEFRERCIGILEGLTPSQARMEQPSAWAALAAVDGARVPGGETIAEVECRASRAVDDIARKHPGQTVAIVTHGGVLQTLHRHCTGQEYGGKFHNCAINTLWVEGGHWRLGLWDDCAHLEGVEVQLDAFGGGQAG